MGCECLVGLVEMGEGGGPERSLMPPCTKEPPSPALQQCEFFQSSTHLPMSNDNVNSLPMMSTYVDIRGPDDTAVVDNCQSLINTRERLI